MTENSNTGLALSGGGFRATLFHLGAVWRLNELAILPEIDAISSVSGGSILAGLMAARWPSLTFQGNVATNFQDEIVSPIWQFCSRHIDALAVPLGLVSGTWKLERSYQRHLVGKSRLQDMPNKPEFIFNAAHIETGRNCTLSKAGIHTWRLGDCKLPHLSIAKAIAASSACPPAFPPVILKPDPSSFTKSEHADLFHREDLKAKLSLTDGGAYDNIGVHAVRDYETILVSDASAPLRATHGKWLARQFNHRVMRPMETAVEQTRAIRRRTIMEQFSSNQKCGTLWAITTDIRRYPIQGPFSISSEWNQHLSSIRTRLNPFSDAEKSYLINWGYALCDLSMRSYYKQEALSPHSLPFPKHGFADLPSA